MTSTTTSAQASAATPVVSVPAAVAPAPASPELPAVIASAAPEVPACEHGWITESRHRTSEGTVLYVRCVGCGIRRVDLLPGPWAAVALSRPVGG